MLSLSPSLDDRDAHEHLTLLVTRCRTASSCLSDIRRLHERFRIYAATSLAPLPAAGLIITPEIRRQSELYLPVADIAASFNRLYQATLTYPPIFESTPFHNALSWADAFVALPQRFQFSANPSRLLEELINSQTLLKEFLYASFLPRRFYGGFRRYPRQMEFIRNWLSTGIFSRRVGKKITLRCLDAACGAGEDSYGLALLLLENCYHPEEFRIEGWTIEPLEVWAAAHARFPHDLERETAYRRETGDIYTCKAAERILFRTVDLRELVLGTSSPGEGTTFDLVLCNGLLGGPILHKPHDVQRVVTGLAGLLAPGGILLASDSFHGGWNQKYPQEWLRQQFESVGLDVCPAGEGICASR